MSEVFAALLSGIPEQTKVLYAKACCFHPFSNDLCRKSVCRILRLSWAEGCVLECSMF